MTDLVLRISYTKGGAPAHDPFDCGWSSGKSTDCEFTFRYDENVRWMDLMRAFEGVLVQMGYSPRGDMFEWTDEGEVEDDDSY